MSSTSAACRVGDDDLEIVRLEDDPADDEANAAPTKVGPMSKAFVDQLMFKAQLVESAARSSTPMSSRPPASSVRPKAPPTEARTLPPVPPPPPPRMAPPAPPVESLAALAAAPEPPVLAPVASPFDVVSAPAASLIQPQPGPAPAAAAWSPSFAFLRAPRDWGLTIEVSVVLASLAVVITGAVVFLFP